MTAILSCTADDLYLFNLAFAVRSWQQLGVDCIVFFPEADLYRHDPKIDLVIANCPSASFWPVTCPKDKEATYMQCARLYAAALKDIEGLEVLITSDADMCVFGWEYWQQFEHMGNINVIGSDLVPEGQYPMCYISMPCVGWSHVMKINNRTYQECLDDLLGKIETENFRGNYWAKDQETAYEHISQWNQGLQSNVLRASPGTQFATRRADRDGWVVTPNIIDAHLPRPGYTEDNFRKIVNLFIDMYPTEVPAWLLRYQEEYLNLMA